MADDIQLQIDVIAEVQQSRSRFQLERFVVGAHDTAEMRFFQICIELQDMEYRVALAKLTEQEALLKIEKHLSKGTPLGMVKAAKEDLSLQQMRLAMIGAEREVEILRQMFRESPKFTRDEIEHAQPEYWTKRLTRQYELQRASGSVGWAQLDAMIQADIMEPPPVPALNVAPADSISP